MLDFLCKESYDLRDFVALVSYLRSPNGCPWDQVQTQDGYIGYVQKKHLTDPAEETPVKDTGYVEPDYTGNLRDHKIDLAWHQVTVESANSTFPGVMSGVTGV